MWLIWLVMNQPSKNRKHFTFYNNNNKNYNKYKLVHTWNANNNFKQLTQIQSMQREDSEMNFNYNPHVLELLCANVSRSQQSISNLSYRWQISDKYAYAISEHILTYVTCAPLMSSILLPYGLNYIPNKPEYKLAEVEKKLEYLFKK